MKKNMKAVSAAVVLLLSSGVAVAQTRQGGCASVVLASAEKNKGAFDSTFSATSIVDLDIAALFTPGVVQRFGGAHRLEVKIYSPSGNLYQSVAVPFTSDSSKKGEKTQLADYPNPLPTVVLEEVNHGGRHFAARVKLPVAGTPIVANSLYGTWSAVAHVDGEALPCASAARFTITQ